MTIFWTKRKVSTRNVILSVAALCLAAAGLIAGAKLNSTDASTDIKSDSSNAVPAATFPGTGVGAIPDGPAGTPPQYGTPLVISFAVTGVGGAISNIDVNFTATHSWVGDIDAVLAAPGGSPSMVVVGHIGVTSAGSFGDSSNYAGTYTFDDSAPSAAINNIWSVALGTNGNPACTDLCNVVATSYRTTGRGTTGQTNPAPITSLQTTFGALTPGQINGTWTLTFRDGGASDTGSVTAANLIIDSSAPPVDAPLDINADGKTDFVVVRNTGGGPTGQITWFTTINGGASSGLNWGLASDFFVMEDFDNDNKDDITVWRPGSAGTAAFYILNSATMTARVEVFGQTGDDPTIVDDYNNDGAADVAVYRGGTTTADQSVWYYRTVAGGPVFYVPWGRGGDFPAPGDYDGDGSADFVIQRASGGGQANFWRNLTTAADDVVTFGIPTDLIVPGDYDGDGKTDIAVSRGVGGSIVWYYDPSSIAGVSVVETVFGNSATDYRCQGDYDGDGKTDVAVWSPNVDPTQNYFRWIASGTGGFSQVELGQNGDYPVADFNSH